MIHNSKILLQRPLVRTTKTTSWTTKNTNTSGSTFSNMFRTVQCSVLNKMCSTSAQSLHWTHYLVNFFVPGNFVSCDTHEFSLGCDKRQSFFCPNKTFAIRYFCKNAPTWQSENSVLKSEHVFFCQRFYSAYTDTQEFCLQSFSTEKDILQNIYCTGPVGIKSNPYKNSVMTLWPLFSDSHISFKCFAEETIPPFSRPTLANWIGVELLKIVNNSLRRPNMLCTWVFDLFVKHQHFQRHALISIVSVAGVSSDSVNSSSSETCPAVPHPENLIYFWTSAPKFSRLTPIFIVYMVWWCLCGF